MLNLREMLPIETTSPVLRSLLVGLLGSGFTEGVEALAPLFPRTAKSIAGKEIEESRMFLLIDAVLREALPALLRYAGRADAAASLKWLPPIVDAPSAAGAARQADDLIDVSASADFPSAIGSLDALIGQLPPEHRIIGSPMKLLFFTSQAITDEARALFAVDVIRILVATFEKCLALTEGPPTMH